MTRLADYFDGVPRQLFVRGDDDNDDNATPPDSGTCRLVVDGQALLPEVGWIAYTFGEDTATHGVDEGGSISLNRITNPLSAGAHTFDLECREDKGTVYNDEAMISAVLLGSASVHEALVLP